MYNSRKSKAIAIFNSVVTTAESITTALKHMPRTGKRNRNIFIKTYNRRPKNKFKRDGVLTSTQAVAIIGACQLCIIMSQPVRKENSPEPQGGMIVEMNSRAEIYKRILNRKME